MIQKLTHSRTQSFKQCRRAHYYAYELGIRKQTDAKALRMGTAYHAGLEKLALTDNPDAALAAASECYKAAPDEFDSWEWEIEETTVRAMLSGYAWRWGESGIKHLATERQFNLRIKNPATGRSIPGWEWAGKIDGIVELADRIRLAVHENKLLSCSLDSDSDLWRRLQLDPQISGYIVAARELGFPVDTVLYDVTRKPTIKPNDVPILDDDGLKVVLDQSGNRVMTKQGKPRQTADNELGYVVVSRRMTPEEWGEKIVADIGERPDYYYARREIPRLDKDLEEWQAEMYEVQRTISEAQKSGRWFKTVGPNTCDYCPYFGLCSTGSDPQSGSLPVGFVRIGDVHPELGGSDVNRTTTTSQEAAPAWEAAEQPF